MKNENSHYISARSLADRAAFESKPIPSANFWRIKRISPFTNEEPLEVAKNASMSFRISSFSRSIDEDEIAICTRIELIFLTKSLSKSVRDLSSHSILLNSLRASKRFEIALPFLVESIPKCIAFANPSALTPLSNELTRTNLFDFSEGCFNFCSAMNIIPLETLISPI